MNSILVKPWDPEACHALFMTSILVAISAFGAFPSCERYNTFQPIDGLIDIFVLARGMHAILRSSEEAIRKGPLGKAMVGCDCKRETPFDCLAIITPQLNALLAHFEEQTFDLTEDKRKTLVKTVGALIEIAARNKGIMSVKEQRLIFGWPMEFPSTFLTLLRNKDPLAMVILSYYCVLLRSAETKCWYFEGWSSALMEVIITSIASTPFERLIQWPIETIDNMARISVKRKSTGVPNAI
ncbi:hypothetical protein NW768_004955 [Fusarium equiseti]|uniref:Uncharacterized protein n=1 Tax=Fusarium equiseti TaxID=61235 RepID=A0ABQ8RHM8_FUSEQ|nr:hypothetical protein NW768_004955 [Fusarium equiseti]